MVGYGQSVPERRHPSRRSLWDSTNLRAGELIEALPPAQRLQRLRTCFMKSRHSSARSLLQRFLELADPAQSSPCSTARSNLTRFLLWSSCTTCCGAAVVENFVTGR